MGDPLVLETRDGPVLRLTLNDPARLNALSAALIAALDAALARAGQDAGVRVVILSAAGRVFSAGHDLAELQADGPALTRLFEACGTLMARIAALPQPVVAEVQGVATAAGCQLVATCDLAIASDKARFGVNGINLGLFCTTPAVALTQVVMPKVAFEMLSTGAFIPAARALEIGLVNRVVAPDALTDEVRALAETLATKDPAALAMGKRAVRAMAGLTTAEAYRLAVPVMVENALRPDTQAGIAAFLTRSAAPGA